MIRLKIFQISNSMSTDRAINVTNCTKTRLKTLSDVVKKNIEVSMMLVVNDTFNPRKVFVAVEINFDPFSFRYVRQNVVG